MKKIALLLVFLVSVSIALETPMLIFEQRDFGPEYEPDFDDIYVTMDCDSNIINIYITEDEEPVVGAVVRLMYIDYSTPLLAAGPTDTSGKFSYTLVGERDFMTGLFLVVVEKEGYNNKEAHFDIRRCLDVSDVEEEVEELEEEVEEIEEVLPPEEPEEIPPEEPEENVTENVTIGMNETGGEEGFEPEYICAPSLILLLALIPLVACR